MNPVPLNEPPCLASLREDVLSPAGGRREDYVWWYPREDPRFAGKKEREELGGRVVRGETDTQM